MLVLHLLDQLFHKIFIWFCYKTCWTKLCDSLSISGLILRDIKDFWRVALFISTLSYPEVDNASDSLSQQVELHRRKEKYIRVERSISDLGKELPDGCRLLFNFLAW